MFDLQKFTEDCLLVREQSPLVHNITNYVAMNIAANGLLAVGASPLMSFYDKEMEEIEGIASALTVNIGCLDDNEISGMYAAAGAMHRLGKPWVLDPVGAGASKARTSVSLELIKKFKPTVIRGNASEIMCLAGEQIASRGVDSANSSSDALSAAKSLAKAAGAVVSVSGAIDYITDGERVETIANGSPMMSRITAMGCTATAITGAFVAVSSDPFIGALNAMAVMGVAGELAAARSRGTGSLAVAFIDELSVFDPAEAGKLVRQK